MNKNEILKEVADFAHIVNNSLNNKESRQFNVHLKVPIDLNLSDNYLFLDGIIDVCHRKKIEIPNVIGNFLLYDEDLRKDIIYTFILNSNMKIKDKDLNT